MKEKEPQNNVVSLEEYRKRKEQLLAEIESSIQSGIDEIGAEPELEFKFFSEIYSSILQTLARKFAEKGNYDTGSKDYDSAHASMLITFSFSEKEFSEFLAFLQTRLHLIPRILKDKMIVYIGGHDNFLGAPAARIDNQGFTFIADAQRVPLHEEDSLHCKQDEYKKLKELGYSLRDKLRTLLEVE